MKEAALPSSVDGEALRLFTDSVERYGQNKYGFDAYRHLLCATPAFSKQAWNDYAQMGWLSVALPIEDGGFGSHPQAVAALMQYCGERLALEPLFASALVCGQLLALCGSGSGNGEQARSRLDALAGGRLFAFAHSENTSDAFDGPVAAAVNDDKLFGRKVVVLHGDVADELLVSVSEAPHGTDPAPQRLSIYAVSTDQPGIHKTSYRLLDGRGAASFSFDAAQATLLGVRGEGARMLAPTLRDARLALCAEAQGAMRALNRLTLAHLKDRRQFGRPIGMNQALQHRMVEMYMLEQESTAVVASAHRAVGHAAVFAGGLAESQTERNLIGAVAHVMAASRHISHEAVQMHGGMGTTDELAVGHYFKRIMVTNRLLGDRDAHVDAFARADAAAQGRP